MLTRRTAMIGAALAGLVATMPALAEELNLPRQRVDLLVPPFVHPHEQATRQKPKIIEFRMVIEEREIVLDSKGTKFQAMTFNGSIPGPLMAVHEGDYVEPIRNPRCSPKRRLNALLRFHRERRECSEKGCR